MAISTYSELVSTVKDLLALPDAPVATFVSQAEADFRSIRHRMMEAQRRVSMAANVGSIALPMDFVELRALSMDGQLLRPMSRFTQGQVDPNSYFITGTSIMVRPVQGAGAKLLLTYYARIPALSETNPSNWLLEEFPMVYLHATMMHAYEWLRDIDGENASRARFGEAVAQLNLDDKRSLMGGNTPVWPR